MKFPTKLNEKRNENAISKFTTDENVTKINEKRNMK